MYRSPNHPDYGKPDPYQGSTATAPEPSGRVLAAFPRQNREGPPQELRIVLDEYQGNPYISVRLWQGGANGWWPLKDKGVSIRIREAQGVIDALAEALEIVADRPAARPAEPRQRRSAEPPRGRRKPASGLPTHHGGPADSDDIAY